MHFRKGFGHFGTPGKGSRLHRSTFQGFADFAVPCGKGFPDGEPGFPEGLPEKGRDLNRSKNNETPHANSAYSTVADFIKNDTAHSPILAVVLTKET